MRTPSGNKRQGERGVSAVIFAFALTALMGISALAVDIGQAYTERRHDQNTVDAAVMSAMVEGVLGGGDVNKIVAEVRSKVDTTLGRTVDDAAWEACTDPDQLHFTAKDLGSDPLTDCISFSITFEELRVKLPDQRVEGVFGPVVGVDFISVNASAHSKIVNGTGSGGPPFIALSTAGQGDFVCLRTSSEPEPLTLMDGNGPGVAPTPGTRKDPCDSTAFATSSENFGTLLPYAYKNGCVQQNTDVEMAVSIGIDHIMGVFEDGYDPAYESLPAGPDNPIRQDGGAGCTVAFPNTFAVDTGFNAGGLRCALVSQKNSDVCNGVDPRFHQGPYVQETHLLVGEKMDNEPPWTFLRSSDDLAAEGSPQSCVDVAASRALTVDPSSAEYWDHYDKFDAFVECLTAWGEEKPDGSGDFYPRNILFTEDIGRSARFGFIPQVYESDLSKVSNVHIEGFLPVFMYRTYVKPPDKKVSEPAPKMCDSLDTRDATLLVHDAGQQFSCGGSDRNIDRLSSIVLGCGMVMDSLCNKETGFPVSAGLDIYEFRLSK